MYEIDALLDLLQVSAEEAQAHAAENGLVYWETSAKTNVNVQEVFDDIAKRLPRAVAPPPLAGGITLDAPPQAKTNSCCST